MRADASAAAMDTPKRPIASRYSAPISRQATRCPHPFVTQPVMRTMSTSRAPATAGTATTVAKAWRIWPTVSPLAQRRSVSHPCRGEAGTRGTLRRPGSGRYLCAPHVPAPSIRRAKL